MRKIILYMTMTLDGFVAGPKNDLDWFTPPANDEALNKDIVGIVESVDTWMMGYPTGPGMVTYWRNAEKNEKTPQWEMAVARAVNKLHPIFLSNRDERPVGEAEIVVARNDGETVQRIEEVRRRKGGDVYIPGGVRTGQNFIRLGLVDECILMVHPVAIGRGKRLFTRKTDLELMAVKAYKSGVVQVRYRPRRKTMG